MRFNIPIEVRGEQFLNNSESSKFGELKFRNFGRLASREGGELLEKVTVEESSCSSGRHKGARFSGLTVQLLLLFLSLSLFEERFLEQRKRIKQSRYLYLYLDKEFSIGVR